MGMDFLRSYLEETAGDQHRGTIRYDGNATDTLYLRDDIKEERLQSQIDRMIRRLRPEASAKEEQSFRFGDLHATVRVFDEALIFHFPLGKDRGIVVAFEPEIAQSMHSFVEECHRRIDR